MREMILNIASLRASNVFVAQDWMKDMILGMVRLHQSRCVEPTLRLRTPVESIQVTSGHSLAEVARLLRRSTSLEEYRFFLKLTSKLPLLTDIGSDVLDRFHGRETVDETKLSSDELVLCSLMDSILVGFPSEPGWDRDEVIVRYNELVSDESIALFTETVDNLTRRRHATAIISRHKKLAQSGNDPDEIWDSRADLFPGLRFGVDVRQHLKSVPTSSIPVVRKRLCQLNKSASMWAHSDIGIPQWYCRVSDESASVKQNRKLRQKREFRSEDGQNKLFFWHARYGSSGRIHFRWDSDQREFEIGYIGFHLPL